MLKSIWKCKEHRIAKTVLKKQSKDGGLALPSFKTIMKTVWPRRKHRHTDPRGRAESPETSLHVWTRALMSDQTTKRGKSSLFEQMVLGQPGTSTQRKNLDPSLQPRRD